MTEQNVVLHVYDLTRGLARTLSMPFLGKQLDGVWHTGVVVYGKEWFFGGMGVENCPPGGTVLGAPDRTIRLGETAIPQEMFHDYLAELGSSTFRPDSYDLFHHNCNTFSNEVSQFLTGATIPAYITDLPNEVLGTPLGAMIQSFANGVPPTSNTAPPRPPGGGHSTADSGRSQAPPPRASATRTSSSSSSSSSSMPSNPPAYTSVAAFHDNTVLSDAQQNFVRITASVSENDKSVLTETIDFLSIPDPDWSLSPTHIRLLVRVAQRADQPVGVLACRLLQELLTRYEVAAMVSGCTSKQHVQHDIVELLRTVDSASDDRLAPALKLTCNCLIVGRSESWMMTGQKLTVENKPAVAYSEVVGRLCAHALLGPHRSVAVALASVLTSLTPVAKETVAVEVGSALVQVYAEGQVDEATGTRVLKSLASLMKSSAELIQLVQVLGLDLTQAKQWKSAAGVCSTIEGLMLYTQ